MLIIDVIRTSPADVKTSLKFRRAARVAEAVEKVKRFFCGCFAFAVCMVAVKVLESR
jgi:hypothetical protein